MIIDCESCDAKPLACGGCVVSFLLDGPVDGVLESEELRALDVLADSGMVPPLRLTAKQSPAGEASSGKMAG